MRKYKNRRPNTRTPAVDFVVLDSVKRLRKIGEDIVDVLRAN